jgi:hypothetical protein
VPRAIGCAVVAALFASGCLLAPIDLANRPCPCAGGWVCTRDGICIEEGLDAGLDPRVVPDAAPPIDAHLDAPSAEPACDVTYPDAIFCDGFEWDYPLERGAWGWEFVVDGSLETTEDPPAAVGMRSLRSTIGGRNHAAALGVIFARSVLEGDLWIRGYFRIGADVEVGVLSLAYVTSVDLAIGIALQLHAGGNVGAWLGTIEPPDYLTTTAPFPRDRWVCLQLHIVVDDIAGAVELFVDDTMVGSRTGMDSVPLARGGLGAMVAGIEYAGIGQGAGVVHSDDIVVGTTRVPCAR